MLLVEVNNDYVSRCFTSALVKDMRGDCQKAVRRLSRAGRHLR